MIFSSSTSSQSSCHPSFPHYFLLGWGANTCGQLATHSFIDYPLPHVILSSSSSSSSSFPPHSRQPLFPPIRIIGGANHSFLIDAIGQLFAVGSNQFGQLGILSESSYIIHNNIPCIVTWTLVNLPINKNNTTTTTTTTNNNINDINDIALGWSHTLINFINGHVLALPVNNIIKVAAGLRHSLALSQSYFIYAWGASKLGQCGYVSSTTNGIITIELPCHSIPKSIATGAYHSVVCTNLGSVYTFGHNKYGQLGYFTNTNIHIPTCTKFNPCTQTINYLCNDLQQILFFTNNNNNKVISIHTGWSHTVILTELGHIYTFGRHDLGQLGSGTMTTNLLLNNNNNPHHSIATTTVSSNNQVYHHPLLVPIPDPVQQVVTGSEHVTVLTKNNNKVYAWGWNEHGNCGIDNNYQVNNNHHDLPNVITPTPVAWEKAISSYLSLSSLSKFNHDSVSSLYRVILIGGGYAHTFLVVEKVLK